MIDHRTTQQSNPATMTDIPDNVICDEDTWEFELDLLGPNATAEQLQEMLRRAPNPQSANAQFVMGYLSHVQISK